MTTRADSPDATWFQAPVDGGHGLVTLVEGNTFCVAGRSGDIHPGSSEGLFFLDTRLLSRLELAIDGRPIEPLSVQVEDPFAAVHIARAKPEAGEADAPVAVTRHRYVGRGMRDDVEIRNYGVKPTECEVSIAIDADFANLFAVKGGLPSPGRVRSVDLADGVLLFTPESDEVSHRVSVRFDPPPDTVEDGAAFWLVHLDERSSWSMCLELGLWLGDELVEPSHPCGTPVHHAEPAKRMAVWRSDAPRVETDYEPLSLAIDQAAEDLGALRILDPDHPERAVVAAGAPWFMTLFGRDALLAGWMALMADPTLALGVLETLADLQGREIDPETEEQPGRILHEVRFDKAASLSLGGGQVYYGTIDSTPLFVMLAGEVLRWGLDGERTRSLLPHIDLAMQWIDEFGDLDGDGYVEYRRMSEGGLPHQGWKDSRDGVRFASGEIAEPPIALCEVQGYVYGAHVARADIADQMGDSDLADEHRHRASELRRAFNRDFWSEELGRYVLALDGAKRQVDALASNVGHCLWTGIVDEEKAAVVAGQFVDPDMFSGWGLRTMAASMDAYNPVSYHAGSVWPHDTAIGIAGLRRYGFTDEANELALGLLDLAASEGGRLPELVAGFSRDEFAEPVPYPTSCSPQAWAAAAPLLLLRVFLGFEPDIHNGTVRIDPRLPERIPRLRVVGIPVAKGRLTIGVEAETVDIEGVPSGVEIVRGSV